MEIKGNGGAMMDLDFHYTRDKESFALEIICYDSSSHFSALLHLNYDQSCKLVNYVNKALHKYEQAPIANDGAMVIDSVSAGGKPVVTGKS